MQHIHVHDYTRLFAENLYRSVKGVFLLKASHKTNNSKFVIYYRVALFMSNPQKKDSVNKKHFVNKSAYIDKDDNCKVCILVCSGRV